MKLIIIIQTLIIIAGGYYVYLLTNKTEVVAEPVPTIEMDVAPVAPREGYVPPTENPPMDPVEAKSEVTGHSDVGMEFPVPDEEIQVQ
jgi:hypothetical protein